MANQRPVVGLLQVSFYLYSTTFVAVGTCSLSFLLTPSLMTVQTNQPHPARLVVDARRQHLLAHERLLVRELSVSKSVSDTGGGQTKPIGGSLGALPQAAKRSAVSFSSSLLVGKACQKC